MSIKYNITFYTFLGAIQENKSVSKPAFPPQKQIHEDPKHEEDQERKKEKGTKIDKEEKKETKDKAEIQKDEAKREEIQKDEAKREEKEKKENVEEGGEKKEERKEGEGILEEEQKEVDREGNQQRKEEKDLRTEIPFTIHSSPSDGLVFKTDHGKGEERGEIEGLETTMRMPNPGEILIGQGLNVEPLEAGNAAQKVFGSFGNHSKLMFLILLVSDCT